MGVRSGGASFSRKTLVVAVTLGMAAAVAGASWSAQGTGAAKAQAGRLQPVTASPATPSTELFPGTSADSALTLNNPNPVAMAVTSIVGDGPITSSSAACDAAGHGVTFLDQTGLWEVAKNAGLSIDLADSVAMSLDSDEACQGATFTIPVAVTASVSGQGGAGTTTTTSTTAPAALAWQPPSYVFPATEVNNAQGPMQFFGLRNVGGASTAVELGTFGSNEFVVESTTCSNATLAPNQSCSLAVRFRPAAVGTRSAIFQARIPGATSNWVTLNVSGSGYTNGTPTLSFNPPNRDFGTAPVNSETSMFVFQVQNTSGFEARNVAVSLTGTDPSSFLIRQNTCPPVLSPSASCQVGVTFRPVHAGYNAAQLRVSYTSTSGQPFATLASLTGNGA